VTRRAEHWIRRTTIGCVGMLALIAGTVSYLHMHVLVELHGQPGWVAVLTPLSVDGMIVAVSTTLLAESRSGGRGGLLPWALLVIGSMASLAANVAVAEPTTTGRVIAAWPSFALIGSYELLMRQIRAPGTAPSRHRAGTSPQASLADSPQLAIKSPPVSPGPGHADEGLKHQAWEWALAHRGNDGRLPTGTVIASQFGRHERWGRLVKQYGSDRHAAAQDLTA
jgi:Protein of unknown function (DUF2637)